MNRQLLDLAAEKVCGTGGWTIGAAFVLIGLGNLFLFAEKIVAGHPFGTEKVLANSLAFVIMGATLLTSSSRLLARRRLEVRSLGLSVSLYILLLALEQFLASGYSFRSAIPFLLGFLAIVAASVLFGAGGTIGRFVTGTLVLIFSGTMLLNQSEGSFILVALNGAPDLLDLGLFLSLRNFEVVATALAGLALTIKPWKVRTARSMLYCSIMIYGLGAIIPFAQVSRGILSGVSGIPSELGSLVISAPMSAGIILLMVGNVSAVISSILGILSGYASGEQEMGSELAHARIVEVWAWPATVIPPSK